MTVQNVIDFQGNEGKPSIGKNLILPEYDEKIAEGGGGGFTPTETQLAAINSGIDSTKVSQISTNTSDISTIEGKIPSGASTSNQLADKEFVNSSISSNTATFRGTYNLVSDLSLTTSATQAEIATALTTVISTVENNDYCFVQIPTSDETPTQISRIDRYKYNGTAWVFEYSLNNSSFTANQWAAINSGITNAGVEKLTGLSDIKSIGSNLSLNASTGELSATDTTYSNFVGTDGTAAGTMGLVPAPATTDAGKFLKADGTWGEAGGGGIKELTSADYDYPTINPWKLATWKLPSGIYKVVGSSSFYIQTTTSNDDEYIVGNGSLIIISKTESNNHRSIIVFQGKDDSSSFYMQGFSENTGARISNVSKIVNENILNNVVGDLSTLTTTDKSSVVSAINELRYGTLTNTPTGTTAGVPGRLYEYDTTGTGDFELWICLKDNGDNTYIWKQINLV